MYGPFTRDDLTKVSLHNLWTKRVYAFLRDFFDTVEVDASPEADENGNILIVKTTNGKDWRFPDVRGAGGGGSSAYTSYFRVISASDESGAKIGVTDGSEVLRGGEAICGAVKINGVRVEIPEYASPEAFDSAETGKHVWINSWIDAEGEKAEIIVGSAAPPANPNSGYAFANQLLGRFDVVGVGEGFAVANINQDYLRGGEHAETLFGTCEGLEIEAPP